jgi:hypothetical protein
MVPPSGARVISDDRHRRQPAGRGHRPSSSNDAATTLSSWSAPLSPSSFGVRAGLRSSLGQGSAHGRRSGAWRTDPCSPHSPSPR